VSLARTALRELAALADVLAQKPALSDISLCRRQAEAQPSLDRVAKLPPLGVLEAVRRELSSACAMPDGAVNLPSQTLRMTPLVLWNGEPQAASFPGLLEVFLRAAQMRPRWLRDLIEAWLRDFAPDRILLLEAGFAIAGLLAETKHPRLTAWRHAHERLSLFDANEGPRRVGHVLFHGPDEVTTILSGIGMDDPLRANGGFFRAAMAEIVRSLPKALRAPSGREAWSRAAELLEVRQTQRDRFGREVTVPALRFAELAGSIARACLDPWLCGEAATVPQEEIKGFLLRVLGDPRVEKRPWQDVGEEATGLMRAWLAKASLEAFLSLISQDNNAAQWRNRQKFWRACLAKMPSAEVWVVLGPGLAGQAKALRDLAGGFGEMDGTGANEQGVLLMKMGNLILCEWSNVGPLRAWDIGAPTCPKLYNRKYDSRQLAASSLAFPQQPPSHRGRGLWHQGPWQERAAALLLDRVDLRLVPKDYL
jgi:hypothetical protein